LSALDAVRRAVGEEFGPDLVVGVQGLSDEQVLELVGDICAQPPTPQTSPDADQVWPLVTARASTFASTGGMQFANASGPAGLSLTEAMDPRFMGSGRFTASVLHALLYCHGLVIEDPVAMAADLYQGVAVEMRPAARRFIVAATATMSEVAALLDAGVVQTYFTLPTARPDLSGLRARVRDELAHGSALRTEDVWAAFEATYVDGLSGPLRAIWRHVRTGNRTPPLDLVEGALAGGLSADVVETFVDVLASLKPSGVVDNSVDVVLSAAAEQTLLGGHHDLLCPTSLFAQLLFLGSPNPIDALRIAELARVDVPGIDSLLVEDVVRIRQASDAFDAWRRSLSVALERSHALRREVDEPVDTTAVVAESVADARAALFREAKRSRLLSGVNLTGFVAGALGGGIGALTGGAGAIALGAGGGLLPAVVAAVIGGRSRPPGYVERHYLVFERNRSRT
jgi:hypothetical protein